MKKLLFVFALFFLHTALFVQLTSSSAVGLRYAVPTGATADVWENGYGVTGTYNISIIPLLDITFEGSWHSFKGKEFTLDENGTLYGGEDISIFGFVAGPVLTLGMFDVGVKGGYFFNDIDEVAIFPFAQIDILMFSVGAEYKATGDANWFSVYANFNF
jgi:hypothetical protein